MPPDRFVVDASVAVKWVLPEPGSGRARRLLERAARSDTQFLAPDIFVGEVANVIWKRCRLRGELLEDEAREALSALLGTLPEIIPSATLVAQAFELALSFRRPVYDCIYVALALRDGCPLVTSDLALARSMGPATGQVIHLDDLELGG